MIVSCITGNLLIVLVVGTRRNTVIQETGRAKRKVELVEGEEMEREGSKTRRLRSPTPMELGTPLSPPARGQLPSLGELAGALNSTR